MEKKGNDLLTHKLILTPGPTEMPRELLLSLAKDVENPDLDQSFYDFYHGIYQKLARLLNSWNHRALIMLGEAMLGLEASIINLLEEGEEGLVLSNGFFGDGFSDLLNLTGRKSKVCKWDEREGIPADETEKCIEQSPNSKAVYMVHCETPTGVLNPVEKIAPIASESGKYVVVDAVSSMFTTPIYADEWKVDVLIGGSQKALNLPPGLTILMISDKAWKYSISKNTKSFYLSFSQWRGFLENREMTPYTHSMNHLRALDDALIRMINEGEDNVYRRHEKIREASWKAASLLGLELFPRDIKSACPGVTAVLLPSDISSIEASQWIMNRYGIMLGTGLGKLRERILRIGHMGFTASLDYLLLAYLAVGSYLKEKGKVRPVDIVESLEAIMRIK
ncbi:MAG: alanine--glyoxylate aminotransferase family protein [Fervidicoccaceae archaeon]